MVRSRRSTASVVGGLFLTATGLVVATGPGSPAAAVPTTGNVSVAATGITLSGVTPAFTLAGDPETTQTANGAVTMAIRTNNRTGYNVTVQAAAANLTGLDPLNTDVIPVGNLKVRKTGGAGFTALSNSSAVTVENKASRSAGGAGDALSNDYQVDIPFVNADTYSVVLDYTATVNP
jgi:large repetitive protein